MDYRYKAGFVFLATVLFSSVGQSDEHQRDIENKSIAVEALANSSSGGKGKDTGIDISERDVLIVRVNPSEKWSAGSDEPCTRESNADGLTECYGPFNSANLTANYGSLVGRIGDGPFFLVGTSYKNEATGSGRLLLFYWDSNAGDNSGSIIANLAVKRRPENPEQPTFDLSTLDDGTPPSVTP